jgi:hypothetical protein
MNSAQNDLGSDWSQVRDDPDKLNDACLAEVARIRSFLQADFFEYEPEVVDDVIARLGDMLKAFDVEHWRRNGRPPPVWVRPNGREWNPEPDWTKARDSPDMICGMATLRIYEILGMLRTKRELMFVMQRELHRWLWDMINAVINRYRPFRDLAPGNPVLSFSIEYS